LSARQRIPVNVAEIAGTSAAFPVDGPRGDPRHDHASANPADQRTSPSNEEEPMRYTIATPPAALRSEVDRLFDAAFAPVFGRELVSALWTPVTDVRESEQEVVIEMELPGVAPEAVELTADRGVLRVRGEKASSHRASDQRVHLSERVHGTFERAFRLPKGLDEAAIAAEFEHGVLRVRLPKSALPQPRRIEVKVAAPAATNGDAQAD
jgi:HSP20 family protein